MNINPKEKKREKPKYLAIHLEIVWGHVVGVAILTIFALFLIFFAGKQHARAIIWIMGACTFIETAAERKLLSNARKEEAEFVRWRRRLKRSGHMQTVPCTLVLDYEGSRTAMIVGKLRLPHSKSLYFVSPKFRWNGTEDIEVEADVFYMPGEKQVYISSFWPNNRSESVKPEEFRL